jgi:GNAT superfamily N-acetyltransferase
MWNVRRLSDKSQILAYLETERGYAAYAIGDLEPGMYEQCSWAGAKRDGKLQALALHFGGLTPPALFLMGARHGLRAILEQQVRLQKIYFTCRQDHLPVTEEFYTWDRIVPMWRMVLQAGLLPASHAPCLRLGPAHAEELLELYRFGGGDAFTLCELQQGVFYGVRVQGTLVSVAGTHLVSPTYSVAAVGNVFTHPNYRGHGYGSATTRAVVHELLQRGIRDVVLNVEQANMVAEHLYTRLGFERHCPFLEGPASSLMGKGQRGELFCS